MKHFSGAYGNEKKRNLVNLLNISENNIKIGHAGARNAGDNLSILPYSNITTQP